MSKLITLFILLAVLTPKAKCQNFTISGVEYKDVAFNEDVHEDISRYLGSYVLGKSKNGGSEGIVRLMINTFEGEVFAQIREFEYTVEGGRSNPYKHIFTNLTNVRINSGWFISSELVGRFVDVTEGEFKGKALLIDKSSIESIVKNEFGFKTGLNEYYKGWYHFASYRSLTEKELRLYSKEELQIMRNEIFARYDYDFKTEKMQEYFDRMGWHVPNYSNVNDLLTELEIRNINLIRSLEK
ncbi:YARHG domain-containing protein [Fulvitalea axinellae]